MTFKEKLFLGIFMLFSWLPQSYAQNLEVSTGLGYGRNYIIESIEEAHELDISATASLYANIKYQPPKWGDWGLGLHIQHFETRVKGITKVSSTPIDGFIANTSYFLVFEKAKPLKKHPKTKFISSYTIGLSNENYIIQSEQAPRRNLYASVGGSLGFSFSLSDNISLRVTDMLMITDVFKGLSYLTGNWEGQSAGEDISEGLIIGIIIKL